MNPYNTKTYLKYKILLAPHSGKKVIQFSYNTQDKRTRGKSTFNVDPSFKDSDILINGLSWA